MNVHIFLNILEEPLSPALDMYITILSISLQIYENIYGENIHSMMTSSNGNIFRFTGHLCEEFTGDRWIPRTKARDALLWCFLWSVPE